MHKRNSQKKVYETYCMTFYVNFFVFMAFMALTKTMLKIFPEFQSNQAEPAPSQHTSNFDLRSHPNAGEEAAQQQQQQQPAAPVTRSPPVSAAPAPVVSPTPDSNGTPVRVRLPPGGKSSGGFW